MSSSFPWFGETLRRRFLSIESRPICSSGEKLEVGVEETFGGDRVDEEFC